MKVRMEVSQYGPDISRNVGDEVEVSNAEAKALMAKGFAVPVRKASKETTSKRNKRVEKAVK